MAEVYDTVPDFPKGVKTILDDDRRFKGRSDRSLERFIALHEDVQVKVIAEGQKIAQRSNFRLRAHQERHVMRLREELADAHKTGDPELIKKAQATLDHYYRNRTQVLAVRSDIDYYISLFREDGREFHVEVENDGGRGGLTILKQSLRN